MTPFMAIALQCDLFLKISWKLKKKSNLIMMKDLPMKNNSLPFPSDAPTSCSATERPLLLSVSVFNCKAYLSNVLIPFLLDLPTSDVLFRPLAVMHEELALYSSPVAGSPQCLGILGCCSCMRMRNQEVCLGPLEGSVRVRMGVGVGVAVMLCASETLGGVEVFFYSGTLTTAFAATVS